ncbi:MAG: hypothetical protein EON61_08475 [Alphaproteobacteria bacterium]|nr:MAG: hypothetical protein EON61_08475 [Alphaproteobacteria bacterium]
MKRSSPGQQPFHHAKQKPRMELAEIEGRLLVITSEAAGTGADLTHKQAHALAGRWYRTVDRKP